MNKPLISVLVPVYNRKEWIPLTLNSLRQQTYPNVEVVIVNDGGESIDDILANFQDLEFVYVEHEKNKGLPAARNTALRHATGEYISLLDSDDIYMPQALEFRMWNINKLNVDIVYTRSLQNIYEPRVNDQGQKIYQLIHQQLYWNADFDRDNILISNIAPCCNPLFSRKSWEESNYWFDESFTSTEDHDFWCALSRKFDFHDLRLVDAECSYRKEKDGQMTGNLNFVPNWIKMFKKWRHTAINYDYVVESQNRVLRSVGYNPSDFGL